MVRNSATGFPCVLMGCVSSSTCAWGMSIIGVKGLASALVIDGNMMSLIEFVCPDGSLGVDWKGELEFLIELSSWEVRSCVEV